MNRAPFANDVEIRFSKGVNVLSGINGRGKTTILSYIVDSFYEMARLNYPGSFEGKENQYYRVSSSIHSIDSSKPSIVYIRFKLDSQLVDYIDVRGKLSEAEYNSLISYEGKIEFGKIQNVLRISDVAKLFSCKNDDILVKNAFTSHVLTYFPSYRYELPGYLNNPYKETVEISNTPRFSGVLPNPIEVCSGLTDLSGWILDVVLDWEVNKKIQRVQSDGRIIEEDRTPERAVWTNLSSLIKSILVSKDYPGVVRFGIGRRNKSGNRISVVHETPLGKIEPVCPNLSLLSSGEAALLCLFGEIIRQSDRLQNNISLNQIKGVVLIDEIEKHLHVRLQKEVLPKLLHLFPNVQFIISSHSPFLNMGLSDTESGEAQIIDLDNGGTTTNPTNNELYQDTYELFLNERNRFASEYAKVNNRLKQITRPVVITEGKTDIKHIIKAMEKLGIEKRFDTLPEAEQPDGEGTLLDIIKNLCKLPQPRKIIAVFDRDTTTTKDIAEPYKDFGNNVFALRIKCPQCRLDEGRTMISIEYMYSDDEIHSLLSNGCQLFFGNEFKTDSTRRHKTRSELRLALPKGCGCDKIIEDNGGQAVYDNADNNHLAKKDEFAEAIVGDHIQISQESWENFRPTIDMINQIIDM